MATKNKKKKREFQPNIAKLKERLNAEWCDHYTYCFYCVKKYEMSLVSRDPKYMARKKLQKHIMTNHPGMKQKEFNPIKPAQKPPKKPSKKPSKKIKNVSNDAAIVIIQCKLIFLQFLECVDFDTLISCLNPNDKREIASFWAQYDITTMQEQRENKLIAKLKTFETPKNVEAGWAVIDKREYFVFLSVINTNGKISKNICSKQWLMDTKSMDFWSYFAKKSNTYTVFDFIFELKNPTFADIHQCKKIHLPHWYSLYKEKSGKWRQKPEYMENKCTVDILHELLLPSLQSISKILMCSGCHGMSNNTRESKYRESYRYYYIMWSVEKSKQVRLLQINYHTANGDLIYEW